MREVVLGEEYLATEAPLLVKPAPEVEATVEVPRHAPDEGGEGSREAEDPCLDLALQLGERLLEEDDDIDVGGGDPCGIEACRDGACRIATVVLDTRQPLFLHRQYDLAVAEQASRRVVVAGRQPEHIGRHRSSERRAKAIHGGESRVIPQ